MVTTSDGRTMVLRSEPPPGLQFTPRQVGVATFRFRVDKDGVHFLGSEAETIERRGEWGWTRE